MKINPNITMDEFRREMQHRVVKYPLNSLSVRLAVRFARQHSDPEFYRIAVDKVHAQKKFQRELYGPGVFERLFNYLSLGSLREVVVMLTLVIIAVLTINAGQKLISRSRTPEITDHEIIALANRLGVRFEHSPSLEIDSRPASSPVSQGSTTDAPIRLSEEDIQRISVAVIQAIQKPLGDANVLQPISQTGSR